ncbi:MAG: 4Fe-4S dicluster domain-containing protein [Deltaproteobacteria bacterium]|nr:4Fe-4S dicluster domain-containing protein [Deltaproteobacteria bacterium]
MSAERKTSGKGPGGKSRFIPIYVLGNQYEVPPNLTIQKAMEYVGYRFVRNCGCRGGICGACVTEYRTPGDYKLKIVLACQTVIEAEMQLTQISSFPSHKEPYDLNSLRGDDSVLVKIYPELLRCVQCNTCTRVCPQEIKVMEYIAAAMRGDIEKVAELSFECIMCGTCASKCPAELSQHQIAMLARRIHGRYILPPSGNLQRRVGEIEGGRYLSVLDALAKLDRDQLKDLYSQREQEPQDNTDWEPQNRDFPEDQLLSKNSSSVPR